MGMVSGGVSNPHHGSATYLSTSASSRLSHSYPVRCSRPALNASSPAGPSDVAMFAASTSKAVDPSTTPAYCAGCSRITDCAAKEPIECAIKNNGRSGCSSAKSAPNCTTSAIKPSQPRHRNHRDCPVPSARGRGDQPHTPESPQR